MIMLISEVAQYLRCHQTTLYKMLKKSGLPPHFKIGADYRFSKEAIDEWIKKQQEAGK